MISLVPAVEEKRMGELGLTLRIKSQLRAAKRHPGIWSGCPPGKYIDAELALMLDNGLIEWVGSGYALTERGNLAIPPGSTSTQGDRIE